MLLQDLFDSNGILNNLLLVKDLILSLLEQSNTV